MKRSTGSKKNNNTIIMTEKPFPELPKGVVMPEKLALANKIFAAIKGKKKQPAS